MARQKEQPEHKRPRNNWHELGWQLFLEGWTYEKIANHSDINLTTSAVWQYANKHDWVKKRDDVKKTKVRGLSVDPDALWRLKCPELQEQIYALILEGAHPQSIAELYGFTKEEFNAWTEEDDTFKRKIQQAIRKYELEMLTKIEGYGGKDWKSKQWLLENHSYLKDYYKPKATQEEGIRILIDFNRAPIQQIDDQTVVTLIGESTPVEQQAINFFPDSNLQNSDGRDIEAVKTTLLTTAIEEETLIDPIAEKQKHLEYVRALQAARKRAADQRKQELDNVLPNLAKQQKL